LILSGLMGVMFAALVLSLGDEDPQGFGWSGRATVYRPVERVICRAASSTG
jgi:hypothetical protein